MFGSDQENTHSLSYVVPTLQVRASNTAKRSAEENCLVNKALDVVVIPSGHQDCIARALAYSQR